MNARYRSLLLMLVVLLVLFGTRAVDSVPGHGVSVQGLALLFVLGAVVGATLGLRSPRSRSGDE